MSNSLIQKLIYKEFEGDNIGTHQGALFFTTKSLKDTKKAYKILNKLGLKWRTGTSLLDEDQLNMYFKMSMVQSSCYCIVIDIFYGNDDGRIIACETDHAPLLCDIPLDINKFCTGMRNVKEKLKLGVDN